MSTLFPERIETERLRLEPIHEAVDPLEYYEICAYDDDIDEVTEYLTWNPPETPKATVDFVEQSAENWDDNETATYVIFLREGQEGAGEIAGGTGLHLDWEKRTAVLGMWLRKRFWGRGYSGERAAALIEVAFDRLDLEVVGVSHMVGNENSRRVIERYVETHGGRHEGRLRNWVVRDGEPVDCHRYTISRAEYEASR